MSVQMELHKIIINDTTDQQIIMLKEIDGDRKFPMVIGNDSATAIERRLKGMQAPRPLTGQRLPAPKAITSTNGHHLQPLLIVCSFRSQ